MIQANTQENIQPNPPSSGFIGKIFTFIFIACSAKLCGYADVQKCFIDFIKTVLHATYFGKIFCHPPNLVGVPELTKVT